MTSGAGPEKLLAGAPRDAQRPAMLASAAWAALVIGAFGALLCAVGSRVTGPAGLDEANRSVSLVPRHLHLGAALLFAAAGYALPFALIASSRAGHRARLWGALVCSLGALGLGCRSLAQGWSVLQFFALIPVCLLALRAHAKLRAGEVAGLSIYPGAHNTR